VKLGHVSLDGTKVRANASVHKAISAFAAIVQSGAAEKANDLTSPHVRTRFSSIS